MKVNNFFNFLLFISLISCNSDAVSYDFCAVAKSHSTYVNYDTTSATYSEDRRMRHGIFRTSFDDFLQYSKEKGFPVRDQISRSDTCKTLFVVSTIFIHIIQSDPEYFLSEKVLPQLQDYYKEGLIEDRLLLISFYSFLHNREICDSTLEKMKNAMKEFGLYEKAFQGDILKNLAQNVITSKC